MTALADLDDVAEVLRVLGHGVRLALLDSLTRGERSVGEIEAQTGVGQPALSQQLGILRKAGLVLTRREAKLVYYRIDQDRIALVGRLVDSLGGLPATPVRPADDRFTRGGTAATFPRVSRAD